MFGLSKREKEEKEIQESVTLLLREVMDAFFLPLAEVASNHEIKLSDDIYMSERYLIVVKAFAVAIGQKVNVEIRIVHRALKKYLSEYDQCPSNGNDMYRKMAGINPDRYASLVNAANMAATFYGNNKDRNESLLKTVVHTYLFESEKR